VGLSAGKTLQAAMTYSPATRKPQQQWQVSKKEHPAHKLHTLPLVSLSLLSLLPFVLHKMDKFQYMIRLSTGVTHEPHQLRARIKSFQRTAYYADLKLHSAHPHSTVRSELDGRILQPAQTYTLLPKIHCTYSIKLCISSPN
jgi:hypothetical protein